MLSHTERLTKLLIFLKFKYKMNKNILNAGVMVPAKQTCAL